MPTYVYECSSCQSTFEVEQRITENPLDSCTCGATGTVKRLIQPIAVMFKGSGFHINDYKSSSAAPAAEAKTETKSEPKATESAAPAVPAAADATTS
jgi:putative FmdB family regulatory protein